MFHKTTPQTILSFLSLSHNFSLVNHSIYHRLISSSSLLSSTAKPGYVFCRYNPSSTTTNTNPLANNALNKNTNNVENVLIIGSGLMGSGKESDNKS